MMASATVSAILFPAHDRPVRVREAFIFLAVTSFLIYAGIETGLGLYLALIPPSLLAGIWLMRHPVYWMAAVILGYMQILWQWTTGMTVFELVHGVIFYGGLGWWFFERVVVQRKPIEWSAGTKLFVAYLALVILTMPLSFAFDADAESVARETVIMAGLLFCIPIASEVRKPRDMKILATAGMMLPIIFALRNIASYQQKVLAAVQYWQVGASRAAESYFLLFFGLLLAISLLVSSRSNLWRFIWLSIIILCSVACVLTFFRSLWITILLCIPAMGFFLGKRYWKSLLIYGTTSLAAVFILFQLLFGGRFDVNVIGKSVADRFTSSSRVKIDPSLRNRNTEAERTLAMALSSPIVGTGISTTSEFINKIVFRTVRARWNHNAFPWMLYHFGIVGSLLLLASYFAYVVLGFRLHRRLVRSNAFDEATRFQLRALLVAGLTFLLGILFMFWINNPYLDRGSFLCFSCIYAFFDVLDRRLRAAAGSADTIRST